MIAARYGGRWAEFSFPVVWAPSPNEPAQPGTLSFLARTADLGVTVAGDKFSDETIAGIQLQCRLNALRCAQTQGRA